MRKTIISLIIATGCMAGGALADELKMQENAPDRYIVVKGDTLWDISGRFLKQPWRWPEIWNLNKEQIKDPHWIYPGNVIVLDRSSGKPQLKLLTNDKAGTSSGGDGRLSPGVRTSPLSMTDAISSIPAYAVEPYLKRPIVIEPDEFNKAPRVAAGPEERVVFASMDTVYAVGLDAPAGDVWQVYRKKKPLIDPDDITGKRIIGYEAHYVGEARVDVQGKVSTLKVLKSSEEIVVGDRLIKSTDAGLVNFVPRLPTQQVEGKVVSTYGDVSSDAGTFSTIVLNRGSSNGLEVGHVLFSYKQGKLIKKETREEETLMTPPVKSANIFVYRVFPTISYGLVLDGTLPVNRGDIVRSAEQ